MPSAISKEQGVLSALEGAQAAYAKTNPESARINKESTGLPGGTTRNVIHFSPFPVVLTKGEGPYLFNADGAKYLDMCGEYSAGMFGHSHPTIKKAMIDAINDGFALGGVNRFEGRLAQLFCSNWPSIDKIRFSNSGTEANMTALSLVKAYTERETVMVFKGGYHGGLASFGKDLKTAAKTMNSPLKWVIAPYNDIPGAEAAIESCKDDLACIFIELLQGSAGCIPADVEFIKMLRKKATEVGAVLMFDEVMTSRMSIGGMQSLIGVTPDMTTLGKYFGGGGQNFGGFGGKEEIMSLIEPGHPKGVYHSGTYNNNASTMAAGVAVLEKVWNQDEAKRLFDLGEWLREELNAVSKKSNSTLQVTGMGSLLSIHFTTKPIRSMAEVQGGDLTLRELFFFDMLRKGFFLAQRGMIALMTVHTKEQLETFVTAVQEFLEDRKEFAGQS